MQRGPAMTPSRPDYGLDAPGVVRNFLVGGPLLSIAGALLLGWGQSHGVRKATSLGLTAIAMGVVFALEGALMIWSSRSGKLRARDRLLDDLALRGDEIVLDVGCGRGLLLIGAAKRVPRGRAVGLDLWSKEDLADNSKAATLANATVEGVADRVEVRDGDMRKLPFAEGSFDVVVANLSIHNIYSREGRREAIREIARVLRPGGRVALQDFRHVAEYAAELGAAGLVDARVSAPRLWIFPPVRVATARKP